MACDGLRADAELISDCPIGLASGEGLEYFQFARAQSADRRGPAGRRFHARNVWRSAKPLERPSRRLEFDGRAVVIAKVPENVADQLTCAGGLVGCFDVVPRRRCLSKDDKRSPSLPFGDEGGSARVSTRRGETVHRV